MTMTMTMTVTAARQPTGELHTVSCWVRPAEAGTEANSYCSILKPDESCMTGCLWRGREKGSEEDVAPSEAAVRQCCTDRVAGAHLQSKGGGMHYKPPHAAGY